MFWGTPSLQFVPWRVLTWDLISSGELPLWNPLVGMGAPLLANYQSAIFYPPNWSLFLLDAIGGVGWSAWGQGLLVFFHLAWAGTGMAYLVKQLGMSVLAQTICGLSFGLSGYLVARSGFLSINAALAWLPWILLFAFDIVFEGFEKKRNPFRSVLILGLIVSMQLMAGHAQTFWYTMLLVLLWAGFWIVIIVAEDDSTRFASIRANKSRILRPWLWLGLVLVVACALSAIQLIPTAEYLLNSPREEVVEYEYAMTYSFWPWRFITLLVPNMFGSPVTGDYWGYGNYWEDNIYIGLLPLVFALAAIIHAIKIRRISPKRPKIAEVSAKYRFSKLEPIIHVPKIYIKLTIFLVCILIVSMVLALGKNTPVFPWLYRHVPTFSLFQAPTRFSILAVISLVLLTGLGVDTWRRPENRALYWTRLATAGALSISIGAGLTWLLLGEVSPTFIRATVIAGFLGVGIGLLTLTAPTSYPHEYHKKPEPKQRIWMGSVVIFVMLDLLVAGWGLIPAIDQDYYSKPSPNAGDLRSQLMGRRLYIPAAEEYRLKFDRFMRFEAFDSGEGWHNLRASMLPNLFIFDGIPSVNNFDPLVPDRYAQWMDNLGSLLNQGNSEKVADLLNLMGAGLVEFIDPSTSYGVRFDAVDGGSRVRWVPCAYYTNTSAEAWDRVFNGQDNFDTTVVLEGDERSSDPACADFAGSGQAISIFESANYLKIRVNSEAPGWLVLSDTWYPGWRAYVDGKAIPIIRANYVFRAVELSAGTQDVELVYSPPSFWLGLGISTLGWTLLCIIWLLTRRRHGESVH